MAMTAPAGTGSDDLAAELDAADAALSASRTLPLSWYWEPRIYDLELECIFRRSWQLVATAEKLERPGQHVVTSVADVPVVVTRDLQGRLNAFLNVCRHRAFPVATADGTRTTLQCKYHAWTYGLDGRLRRARRTELEPDFNPEEHSLVRLAVDSWGGFVFVCLDPGASSLVETHPFLDQAEEQWGLDFSGYDYLSTTSFSLSANWKAYIENVHECYHCPTIHARSFSEAWDVDLGTYHFVHEQGVIGQFTRPNPRTSRFGTMVEQMRSVYVWPSTVLHVDGLLAVGVSVVPASAESAELVSHSYVRKNASARDLGAWMEMSRSTMEEDIEAVQLQHRGLRTGMIAHGFVPSRSEGSITYFNRLVVESLRAGLQGRRSGHSS